MHNSSNLVRFSNGVLAHVSPRNGKLTIVKGANKQWMDAIRPKASGSTYPRRAHTGGNDGDVIKQAWEFKNGKMVRVPYQDEDPS